MDRHYSIVRDWWLESLSDLLIRGKIEHTYQGLVRKSKVLSYTNALRRLSCEYKIKVSIVVGDIDLYQKISWIFKDSSN